MDKPLFFIDGKAFYHWLQEHHHSCSELWVGYYKKATGKPSITWPESVDQALCFGWIDGIRKSIDESRYKIRFTPRRKGSHWSAVNIKRMNELKKLGLVTEQGWSAFAERKEKNSKNAAYEQQKEIKLDPKYLKLIKQNKNAWLDFSNRPKSYQKQCVWWIMSAKKVETKERRLAQLINSCKKGEKIPPLRWQK